MADAPIPAEREAEIDALVAHYAANRDLYRRFLKALVGQLGDAVDRDNGHPISKLVHSVKFRLKDPDHLKDKLIRKYLACQKGGEQFPYTIENLFTTVTDLAGYRILHLHTRQMGEIAKHLKELLEVAHKIVEGPIAKTWDDETREYYRSVNIETEYNDRMYSSVHYVVQPNSRPPLVTIEIQVRTLADEIWGEIDHKLNYPHPHPSLGCREQILALARVTSSCSRLVDAIVTTHEDDLKRRNPGIEQGGAGGAPKAPVAAAPEPAPAPAQKPQPLAPNS